MCSYLAILTGLFVFLNARYFSGAVFPALDMNYDIVITVSTQARLLYYIFLLISLIIVCAPRCSSNYYSVYKILLCSFHLYSMISYEGAECAIILQGPHFLIGISNKKYVMCKRDAV